jgi:hypothetical protein
MIPPYTRTLEEFEAPFSAGSAGGVQELESSSEVALPDAFWPKYGQSVLPRPRRIAREVDALYDPAVVR